MIVVLSLPAVAGDATHDTVFAAAVLVTLVPQGLALMLTVTYAAAALRISRLGALAQRQSAIEAISRVDTFLTDKTGTLTTQRIAFGSIEPVGGIDDGPALESPRRGDRRERERSEQHDRRAAHGPSGRRAPSRQRGVPLVGVRWSAIRFDPGDGTHPADGGTFVLGAPAVLAPSMNGTGHHVVTRAAELAAAGQRVLVVARGSDAPTLADGDDATCRDRFEPLALLTFVEELRPRPGPVDGLRPAAST